MSWWWAAVSLCVWAGGNANGLPLAALVMTRVLRREDTRGRCVLKARLLLMREAMAPVLLLSFVKESLCVGQSSLLRFLCTSQMS